MATSEPNPSNSESPEGTQLAGVSAATSSTIARLHKSERTIAKVRWVAVAFGLLQTLTYYRPYPPGYLALALGVVGAFAFGNSIFAVLFAKPLDGARLRLLSTASLVFDLLIASAFVFVYTFDAETAIWAVIYIIPLQGAIRFGRSGALWVTAGATVIYTLREVFGHYEYGNDWLPFSITFRMGIAFVIAYVAGTSSANLIKERKVVEVANTDLAAMNRSMRDFVSIASHDMRTPLTVIGGLSNVMTSNWDVLDDGKKRELVETIDRQSHALDRLVNDLLTTSSIEAGTITVRTADIDVAYALREVISAAPVAIDLRFETAEALIARADPDHLRRIIDNFVVNAYKYGKQPIQVIATAEHNTVVISVEDSGVGVPPDFVPHLFESFARANTPTTEREEGTGLGLAIVKGLAEANGGQVSYAAHQPSGSIFRLTLPRS